MLETMRQLAVQHLYEELGGSGDPEAWYCDTHAHHVERLLPFLVEEAPESMGNYYVLSADPSDPDVAVLESREFALERDRHKLPYAQFGGPNSGDFGPLVKRLDSGSPKARTLNTSLKRFESIGKQEHPWSNYFASCAAVCRRSRLRADGNLIEGESPQQNALHLAVRHIQERGTCYLAVTDAAGRLPGEVEEYVAYLHSALVDGRYVSKDGPPTKGRCALTGWEGLVYPNALRPAGLNLTNVDRHGAFSNLSLDNAWKRFAVSAAAADALYAFYYHVRRFYITRVAESQALVLPALYGYLTAEQRRRFMREYRAYLEALRATSGGVAKRESKLVEYLAEQGEAVAGLTIVWAAFGNNMEDVQGMVEDVLPSRLSAISRVITAVQREDSPFFPTQPIGPLDLGFNHVAKVLRPPRGWKRSGGADSKALFALTVTLAEAAYHAQPIPRERLLGDGMRIARLYLTQIERNAAQHARQTYGEDPARKPMTLAGWVKHFTRLLYFFSRLEGREMFDTNAAGTYTPTRPELAPFFAEGQRVAGLDNDSKRYAFLLGSLYGRLLQMQDARKVKTSKTLGWLKGGILGPRDLPVFFKNTFAKILAYHNDTNDTVRGMARGLITEVLLAEVGALGRRLGSDLRLSHDEATYYLLLGLASTDDIRKQIWAGKEQPVDGAQAGQGD